MSLFIKFYNLVRDTVQYDRYKTNSSTDDLSL